jgi:hypothetical protein
MIENPKMYNVLSFTFKKTEGWSGTSEPILLV